MLVNRPPRFYHHSTDMGSRNMWLEYALRRTPPGTRLHKPQLGLVARCKLRRRTDGLHTRWRYWLRPNAFKVSSACADDGTGNEQRRNESALREHTSGLNDNLAGAQSFDRAIRMLDPAQFGAYDAMDPNAGRNYRWYSIVGMAPKAGNARTTPYRSERGPS